jgi:hypothetical protein
MTKTTSFNAIEFESTPQTQRKERLWLVSLAGLTLLAFIGHWFFPLTPQRVQLLMASLGLHTHLGGHHFVDQRSWMGITNAADVLSNLPFAFFGAYGLWQAKSLSAAGRINRIQLHSLGVFFWLVADDCGL